MRLLAETVEVAGSAPLTPASHLFDPFEAGYVADPYAVLKGLRESEPVFYSPLLKAWIVTRHDTIREVLRDAERYSSLIVSDPLKPMCPMAREVLKKAEFNVPGMLVNNDPPDHTRIRRFTAAPFKHSRVKSLEPFSRRVTREHLDTRMAGPQPADLVKALTWDVPALVLFELFGVPADEVEYVKRFAESRVLLTSGFPSDEEQVRLAQSAADFYRYSLGLVQRKAAHPQDDYTSDLIRLRDGDDSKATLHEITVLVFNLLFAGHETASSAAANMFLTLLERPGLWQQVCDGSLPPASVVEESLRFEPSIQARRRLAKVDVQIEGHAIPAGSRIFLMLASANRDPERFETPDEFCPARGNAGEHLTFGAGIHLCLGAPLARQELTVMLDEARLRLPGLCMVAGQPLDYIPNTSFRGVRKLMVTW